MRMRMRKMKRMVGILGMACIIGTMPVTAVFAENEETNTSAGNDASSTAGSGAVDTGEYLNGNDSDIQISNVAISDVKAGQNTTVSFTVTGGKNGKKKYEVDSIESVTPNIDSASGIVKNNETSRITTGSGNTLNCSYTFQTKDNVETAYYPVAFSVVYTRKSTDGKSVFDSEYVVTKEFSVKITEKKKVEATAAPEEKAADADLSLAVKNDPCGTYGQSCQVNFDVKSSQYELLSVAPVVDNNFPFKSTGDAYKVIRSNGSRKLSCQYRFTVKDNVSTGYQPVNFEITYKKGKDVVTAKKTINVGLTGKKENKKENGKEKKKSTPRVMVVGYTTDVDQVKPNGKFTLQLQIKNNAATTVKNVKFTLSTQNGEFLPVSGASTAYVDSIAAKGTVTLSFVMKAGAGLGAKSYPIKVKSEYEDASANAYDATDDVSIPVTIEDRISLSDIYPPTISVGEQGDLSLSINNMGAGTLNNVTVTCKGGNIESQEAYLGNISSGSTEYANVSLTGMEETVDDESAKVTILVSYENASGEKKTYKEKTEVYVIEATEEEGDYIDEDMVESQESAVPVVPIVIVVVVVIVAVVLILRNRKKKKQLRLEQELMEDELS